MTFRGKSPKHSKNRSVKDRQTKRMPQMGKRKSETMEKPKQQQQPKHSGTMTDMA
jgi:hypothetical protein